MAQMTNLTDRLSHLRDRKDKSAILGRPGKPSSPPPKKGGRRPLRERRLATDYFMLFAYALLGIAVAAQLALIVWLDFI